MSKIDMHQSSNSMKSEYEATEDSIEEDFIDWAKEEHDYENGHFVCKWVIERSKVTDHKNVHESIICFKTFKFMSAFVEHSKTHLERDTTETNNCSWAGCSRFMSGFGAGYKLVNHYRTHTGERPFRCEIGDCRKRFARVENMRIHTRIHTGDKPFLCKYSGCDKRFTNSSDRKKHAHAHNIGTFHCPVENCQKVYVHPSSYRKHINSEHFERRNEFNFEVSSAFKSSSKTAVKHEPLDESANDSRTSIESGTHPGSSGCSTPDTPSMKRPYSSSSQSTSPYEKRAKPNLQSNILEEYLRQINNLHLLKMREISLQINSNPYHCGICAQKFQTKGQLLDHYEIEHCRPNYNCMKCSESFKDESALLLHTISCAESILEICSHCPHIFSPDKPLEKFLHIRSHLTS